MTTAARDWARAMPWVFVLIWSTGFVVARLGMPHAPPMGFLVLRYAFSVLCFLAWIALARAAWPRERRQWWHLAVTGTLMHAGSLGGVWSAVKGGIGASKRVNANRDFSATGMSRPSVANTSGRM